MKLKYVFTALIFLTAITAFAQPARQDTTLVFSRPGYEKDPVRARLKKVVEKKDNFWVVSMMVRKNVPFESISYADEQLTIRQGPYALFENGKVVIEGHHDKGYKFGTWKSYDANGKPISVYNYRWDKLYGPFATYWENGNPKEKGAYVNGKYVGKHLLFYKDGKVAADELYDDKGLVSKAYFDIDGKTIEKLDLRNL